jgi:hypothetical protein
MGGPNVTPAGFRGSKERRGRSRGGSALDAICSFLDRLGEGRTPKESGPAPESKPPNESGSSETKVKPFGSLQSDLPRPGLFPFIDQKVPEDFRRALIANYGGRADLEKKLGQKVEYLGKRKKPRHAAEGGLPPPATRKVPAARASFGRRVKRRSPIFTWAMPGCRFAMKCGLCAFLLLMSYSRQASRRKNCSRRKALSQRGSRCSNTILISRASLPGMGARAGNGLIRDSRGFRKGTGARAVNTRMRGPMSLRPLFAAPKKRAAGAGAAVHSMPSAPSWTGCANHG